LISLLNKSEFECVCARRKQNQYTENARDWGDKQNE